MLNSTEGKKIMDIQREWCEKTGKSERTFEYMKSKILKERQKSSKIFDKIKEKNQNNAMLKVIENDIDSECVIK